VIVAVENMNHKGYELARLQKAGLPPSELRTYFPNQFLGELVEQVGWVNHPNLGITLDVGHLYTVCRPLGLDYLGEIRVAASLIRHIHVSDNFGRPQGAYHGPREWNTHGEGDVHMPPGWGDIPLADALAQLPDFSGPIVLELRDRYRPYYEQAREAVAALVSRS
jgi:sugar phosphate isomerase/epimerase